VSESRSFLFLREWLFLSRAEHSPLLRVNIILGAHTARGRHGACLSHSYRVSARNEHVEEAHIRRNRHHGVSLISIARSFSQVDTVVSTPLHPHSTPTPPPHSTPARVTQTRGQPSRAKVATRYVSTDHCRETLLSFDTQGTHANTFAVGLRLGSRRTSCKLNVTRDSAIQK
jgi:hypothetical protein